MTDNAISRRDMASEMIGQTLGGESIIAAEIYYANGWRWVVMTENKTAHGIETREEDAAWAIRGAADPAFRQYGGGAFMAPSAQAYGIDLPKNKCKSCGYWFVTAGEEQVCSTCCEDDTLCECGHELYLHDDGKDACAGEVGQPCDCPCLKFRGVK